jgi:hypothetical protein
VQNNTIMINVFDHNDTVKIIDRIEELTASTTPKWGKMNVEQMLAHCNVTYEMVYDNKHQRPGVFKRFLLKLFVKNFVVSDKPYKQNLQTAPDFIISDSRNFENEKNRLVAYITKTQQLGANYFDGKESLSFGKLTKNEWNNLFGKHLDHHLTQFGV